GPGGPPRAAVHLCALPGGPARRRHSRRGPGALGHDAALARRRGAASARRRMGRGASMIDAALREYAEVPDRFAPVHDGSSFTRFDDGRICIVQGTVWAGISGPRFEEHELDSVIALVHELVPADKRQVWWIGPSAEPENLFELLK